MKSAAIRQSKASLVARNLKLKAENDALREGMVIAHTDNIKLRVAVSAYQNFGKTLDADTMMKLMPVVRADGAIGWFKSATGQYLP